MQKRYLDKFWHSNVEKEIVLEKARKRESWAASRIFCACVLKLRASRPQEFAQPFFFVSVFFRVTRDGLGERGTINRSRDHAHMWKMWKVQSKTHGAVERLV